MQQEWIDKGKKYLANTYNRFPIGIAKGEGCWLWDMNGRRYLDFLSGIAVCNLGHAHKNVVEGLAQVLVKDPNLGVVVHFDGNSIAIDLFIIVEYGTRIKSVASSVADSVRYQIEKCLGLPVTQVNVHVRGLRISNPD